MIDDAHNSDRGVSRNIILIAIATILVSISLGINSILIPVALSKAGYTEAFIGGALALETVSAVLVAILLTALLRRYDVKWMLCWTTVIRVLPLFLLLVSDNIFVWGLVIFVHGLALGLFYITTQTWVNSLPIKGRRGLIMGGYNTAYAIGLAAGPIVFQFREYIEQLWQQLLAGKAELIGANGSSMLAQVPGMEGILLLSISLTALAGVPVLFLRRNFPRCEKSKRSSIKHIFKAAPESMLAVAMAGVSSAGVMAFITIYGQKNDLMLDDAALLLTAFIVGTLSLQMVFSWLSDVFNRRHTLVTAAFISMCCAAVLPMVIYYFVPALVLVFLWGGAIGGIYSITLAMLGDKFANKDISTANAGYELMDNAGGVFGVLVIGLFMSMLGGDGMPYVIMLASILYFSFALTRFKVI
jgi:MFS family permease